MDLLRNSIVINRIRLYSDNELSKIDEFILLKGNNLVIRNNDVEFKFRQDSNFFWLSGINEPDYSIYINCYQKKIILIPPKFDDLYPIWHGKLPDIENLKNDLSFDDIQYDIKESSLTELLIKKIQEYRVIKNEYEIKLMENACNISQNAHNYLINNIDKYISKKEKVIANKFIELTENEDNVDGQAYSSICACGSNGAILHYTDNYTELKSGELFLIDAGCEYLNYASDITRTYGIEKIDEYKQKIIDLVTEINYECKLMVKENINFKDIHNLCMDLVYEAIIELDILNDEGKKKDKDFISKIFMPHGLGHFIGLDVHDVGGRLYNKLTGDSITLKENMAITIEPGIYFNKFLLNTHKVLWNNNINNYINIGGVRIEDIVVVKKNKYKQLN